LLIRLRLCYCCPQGETPMSTWEFRFFWYRSCGMNQCVEECGI
jgi:hypothetical protein